MPSTKAALVVLGASAMAVSGASAFAAAPSRQLAIATRMQAAVTSLSPQAIRAAPDTPRKQASAPMVEPGPWPQMKPNSSPSGSSLPAMESSNCW